MGLLARFSGSIKPQPQLAGPPQRKSASTRTGERGKRSGFGQARRPSIIVTWRRREVRRADDEARDTPLRNRPPRPLAPAIHRHQMGWSAFWLGAGRSASAVLPAHGLAFSFRRAAEQPPFGPQFFRKPPLTAIPSTPAPVDARLLLSQLSAYRQPRTARSAFELAVTALPFLVSWLLACLAVKSGYWAGLALAVPAGVFLFRLFLIQHDCGHGAFFRRRATNDWVGRLLGVLTLTPYEYWRRSHAAHHAGTGNLGERGLGDLDTLTVEEFRARGRLARFLYRLYRNPAILFGLGPAYVFLLKHRLPVGMMRRGWSPWLSAMGTNAAIAAAAAGLIWLVGLQAFLLVHIPIVVIAASLGVWFFYVQHQFEGTSWDRDEHWTFHGAALHGSSYYDLPAVLRWLSANVGIHHVHHLASRIPFYRLNEVLRARPALASINRLGITESLKSVRLVLWDERKRRLVSFSEARA